MTTTPPPEPGEWVPPAEMPSSVHGIPSRTAPPPEGTEPRVQINALLTEQGVNMGDHGQDVTRAVVIDPEETVGAMIDRLFPVPGHYSPDKRPDLYLTIRLAVDGATDERPF